MVLSKGFSLIVPLLIVSLVILLAGSSYFYFNSETTPSTVVTDIEDELLKKDVEKINALIEEEGVNTVSDFLYQTLDGELIASDADVVGIKSGTGTKVIGIIKPTNDPSCPNCFQISSGGDTLNVIYNQPSDADFDGDLTTGDIQSGDVVIVNISGLENSDGDDGDNNDQFVIDNIEEVDIKSDNATDQSNDSDIGDNDPSNGSQPVGSGGMKSKYDIDNSGLNIQILSDF